MKRLHLHVSVDNLETSIGFYSTLFGATPAVTKNDYAKWMLEDPKMNFAISARGRVGGVDHVGIQMDSHEELTELATRLKAAAETTFDQEATTCCYARSNKAWVNDPSGARWETFFTFGDATAYGEDHAITAQPAPETSTRCGAPADAIAPACC